MVLQQLVGFVALVSGVLFLIFAYRASNAPVDQITNALTGHFTDQTMWYLIIGVVALVGGLVLLVGRGRFG